jgi:hypothetical protein
MLTCGSSLTAKLLDWLQNLADRPRFSPQQRLIPRIEASPQITLMAGFHQDRCRGFLVETRRPGVFAVGDVRSESVKRVASPVGEGSMVIQFVHKVLAE